MIIETKNPPTLHSHHRTKISLVVIVVVGAVRLSRCVNCRLLRVRKESYPIISKFLRDRG